MTYLKSYNIKYRRGVIIVDILLALSLATLFIFLMTESSLNARDLFDRAKERNEMLNSFENGISTELRTDYSEFIGTPLCSRDFFHKEVVGSYQESIYSNVSITPITLPINPLLPLTDLEIRNDIAYISTDSTTTSDPDLFIFNIHDENNPLILASINTGPGISSIALIGKRIFAAAASTAAQLHVIRLNSLNSLVLEKKFQLPLPYATATPPFGSSIFYQEGLIYLGTEKWDSDEFSVIDMNNPLAPVKLSGFEIGSKVNDVFVHDNFAYVADSDDKQLRIIDLNNISNPILVNSFSPSGGNRQEGKTLSFFEDSLALGRTSGGFDITADYEVFSFASTSSSSLARFDSVNIPGGVYGIVADRSHLFMATREINKEIRIISLVDGYKMGTSTNLYFSLPVAPQTITCDNNRLYVLARSAPVIYEISFN